MAYDEVTAQALRENRELRVALRDLLREVRKINDALLPDGFDARAVRNAETALAAADGVPPFDPDKHNETSYPLGAQGEVIERDGLGPKTPLRWPAGVQEVKRG